jgi:hypothetical protein
MKSATERHIARIHSEVLGDRWGDVDQHGGSFTGRRELSRRSACTE